MTSTHILVLIIMLILPILVALTGMKRMKSDTAPGARGGYRSERSMVSADAWRYAQKTNGLCYLIGGIIMAACSVPLTMILPVTKTFAASMVYALMFVSVWIVCILVLMVITEMNLIGKHFEKNA